MATKVEIEKRLAWRKTALDELQAAYTALVKGGVKSYRIHNRELTRFDLPNLMDEIRKMEEEIDELEAQLAGGRARKAFGIIPRDW